MGEAPEAREITPWTVKNMHPEDREAILRAARRANQTVGEWLRAAAHRHIDAERGPVGMPEAGPPRDDAPEDGVGLPAPADSLAVVLALARVLPGMAEAERCGGVARAMRRVLRQHLRALELPDGPSPSRTRAAPRPALGHDGRGRSGRVEGPL